MARPSRCGQREIQKQSLDEVARCRPQRNSYFLAALRAGLFAFRAVFFAARFGFAVFFAGRDVREVRFLPLVAPVFLPTSFLIFRPATSSPCWIASTPCCAASFTTLTGLRIAFVFDDMREIVSDRAIDARIKWSQTAATPPEFALEERIKTMAGEGDERNVEVGAADADG
jgi:hypothetical protein